MVPRGERTARSKIITYNRSSGGRCPRCCTLNLRVGKTRHGEARQGEARQGRARRSRQGKARLGAARRGGQGWAW